MSENEEYEPDVSIDLPDNILDFPATRTGENVLTQIDPYCQMLLEGSLWDYTYSQDEKGATIRVKGVWENVIKEVKPDGSLVLERIFTENKCKYPDILNAYAWAASHLNMNLNLPQHLAYWLIEEWEGMFYDPLRIQYEDDTKLMTLIDAIDQILKRNLTESIGGSGQLYNIKMSGGHRTVEQVNTRH